KRSRETLILLDNMVPERENVKAQRAIRSVWRYRLPRDVGAHPYLYMRRSNMTKALARSCETPAVHATRPVATTSAKDESIVHHKAGGIKGRPCSSSTESRAGRCGFSKQSFIANDAVIIFVSIEHSWAEAALRRST